MLTEHVTIHFRNIIEIVTIIVEIIRLKKH